MLSAGAGVAFGHEVRQLPSSPRDLQVRCRQGSFSLLPLSPPAAAAAARLALTHIALALRSLGLTFAE
eukprot:967852-Rhodomonas_salina.1